MLRIRPFIAELVGSFCYFFVAAGIVVADQFTHGSIGLMGIALANGLVLAIMLTALRPVAGGYFNPAVTIGLLLIKKTGRPSAIAFIIAQLIGGALAGFLLRAIFPSSVWEAAYLGVPHLTANVSAGAGLFIELLLTFFLMIAVLGTSVDSMAPKLGGFGVGLMLTVDTLIGGTLTGAAANPARAFGPALAANYWDSHWIYWIGPIIGACIASWLYTRWISETI